MPNNENIEDQALEKDVVGKQLKKMTAKSVAQSANTSSK